MIIINGTIEFVNLFKIGEEDLTQRGKKSLCFWQSEFLKSSFNAFSRELGG